MRKSIDGLSILVSQQLQLDPFAGHLFGFCNRSRTVIKLLYWDRNGFCLWQTRLERHMFRWPTSEAGVLTIDSRQHAWLLDGLDPLTVMGQPGEQRWKDFPKSSGWRMVRPSRFVDNAVVAYVMLGTLTHVMGIFDPCSRWVKLIGQSQR